MAVAAFDDAVVKQPEPGWIGRVLGTTVTSLEARLLGKGRGFQSTTWHLQLRCDPPEGGPASVILKSETADQDFNEFSRLNNAFGREVGVYTYCTPRLQDDQTSVFATQASGPCWLLLEDLTSCVRAIR